MGVFCSLKMLFQIPGNEGQSANLLEVVNCCSISFDCPGLPEVEELSVSGSRL